MRRFSLLVACVALTCVLVCYAELVVARIQIGFLQLPPVVIGLLVLLLGGQGLLRRLGVRFRLRAHELFTIYVMMLLASVVSSRGLLEKLIPLLPIANYNATGSLSIRTVSRTSPAPVIRTITDRRRCRSIPTYSRSIGASLVVRNLL